MLVVLVVLAVARAAAADELATARALEAQLEYDQALTLVETTLARGGADPDRYVELHLLAGRLAAGLDRPQVARDHFARVLAVRPTTALPDGTSPKITLPFNLEKARATPLVLALAARRGALSIEATDPLGLVTQVHVRFRIAGASDSRRVPIAKQIALPAEAYVLEVTALDAAGNRLWTGTPPAEVLDPRRTRPPLYAWWPTYVTIGAVAVIAGGVSALRFSSTQDRFDRLDAEGGHDFSELAAIERTGKRWALAANLSFGAAVVSTAIAVVVGARHGTSSVVVAPTANGAAISGRF